MKKSSGSPEIKRMDGSIIIPAGKYASLRKAVEKNSADLSYANLSYANLYSANLGYANLYSADLSSANLSSANLYSANLGSANLYSANLSSANLSYADIDYSCWPLWCGSRDVKVDKKIALQILAHFIVLDCDDQDIIELQSFILSTGLPQLCHRAKELGIVEEE